MLVEVCEHEGVESKYVSREELDIQLSAHQVDPLEFNECTPRGAHDVELAEELRVLDLWAVRVDLNLDHGVQELRTVSRALRAILSQIFWVDEKLEALLVISYLYK